MKLLCPMALSFHLMDVLEDIVLDRLSITPVPIGTRSISQPFALGSIALIAATKVAVLGAPAQ